jgi:hypothetical protein
VVQELLDVFSLEDVAGVESPLAEPTVEQLFLSLSVGAVSGITTPHSVFLGFVITQ